LKQFVELTKLLKQFIYWVKQIITFGHTMQCFSSRQ